MKYIKKYNNLYSEIDTFPNSRKLTNISANAISALENLGFKININESESEYYHLTNDVFMDKVFNRTPIDIDDKIVNKINNDLDVNGVISEYEIVIDNIRKRIKYYKLFIHLVASVSIYAYNDEWYRVYISLSGLLGGGEYYWCDQVHGVIKLIKDTICDEYCETNESNEYYSQITEREFDSLFAHKKSLKFDDKDSAILQNIDNSGDYSFKFMKPNYFKNADHQYQWVSFLISTKIKKDSVKLTGEIYRVADEWYLVEISDDISQQYYKCDQLEGLIDFLKNLKKKSTKSTLTINENNYYELSNSYDDKGRSACKLGYDAVTVLDNTLGNLGRLIHYSSTHMVRGIERPTMYKNYKSSSLSGSLNQIIVFAYEDDWYKVYTRIVGILEEYYWCDQLEGLIKCVEDKFIKYAT